MLTLQNGLQEVDPEEIAILIEPIFVKMGKSNLEMKRFSVEITITQNTIAAAVENRTVSKNVLLYILS